MIKESTSYSMMDADDSSRFLISTSRRARHVDVEAVEKPPNHFFDFWKLNEK